MSVFNWSQTFSNNATADPSVNFAEGQAPSSLNDSCRAVMGGIAKYRDDIAGAIVTTGTATAYAVASYSVFDTLAHLNGQVIAFTPHATNGAGPVTLNVDGLGSKPLRTAPNADLLAGVLIQGTPYLATYNNSDGAFYLQGFYGNPYNVPLLGGFDYWDTVAPNSSFIFPQGQAISRTTYAATFARWGTTFGAGDGSTTFNVPDKRGRTSAMIESTATLLTSTYFGGNSTLMGQKGGSESQGLTQANLPNVNLLSTSLAVAISDTDILHSSLTSAVAVTSGGGVNVLRPTDVAKGGASATVSGVVPLGGSNTAHNNVPPTITCNYVIRII